VFARNGVVTLAINTITKPATAPIITVLKTALTVVNPTFGDQPVPGAEIEYTITVQVTSGSGTAQTMTIKDPMPAGTTYKPNSITLNGFGMTDSDADGDGCDYNSTNATVTVQLGDMTTATPLQTIKFKVTVN
jgi:fimbrial isopeptide formation D2 family protein